MLLLFATGISMPAPPLMAETLPEMTLPSPGDVPPIEFEEPLTLIPMQLPTAAFPVELVPM